MQDLPKNLAYVYWIGIYPNICKILKAIKNTKPTPDPQKIQKHIHLRGENSRSTPQKVKTNL